MITRRELATIRASLLFWREEMCPHGPPIMRPYLEPPDIAPLTADEVDALREQFLPGRVRYGLYDRLSDYIPGQQLLATAEEARQLAAGSMSVAPVLLPVQPQQPGAPDR